MNSKKVPEWILYRFSSTELDSPSWSYGGQLIEAGGSDRVLAEIDQAESLEILADRVFAADQKGSRTEKAVFDYGFPGSVSLSDNGHYDIGERIPGEDIHTFLRAYEAKFD